MEDSFEKSIRETMENPPDFPFDKGMWEKLEMKLDSHDSAMSPAKVLAWWWLLLAVLLLGLLASWLLINHQKNQQRISLLEEQINAVEQGKVTPEVEKRVMVVYDTIIYKTVVIEPSEIEHNSYHAKAIERKHSSLFRPNEYAPLVEQDARGLSSFNAWNLYSGSSRFLAKKPIYTDNVQGAEHIKKETVAPLAFLPKKWGFLKNEYIFSLPEVIPIEPNIRRRSAGSYLSLLLPRSLAVAAGIGVFHSEHLPDTDGISTLASGTVELNYGRHWYLSLGVEHLELDFSLEEEEAEGFTFFTTPLPNNPDDELEGLSGDFDYWQVPLSLKYRIFIDRRIQPYLGMGIVGLVPAKSRISYEFEAEDDDTKYSIVKDNLLLQAFDFSDAFGLLGVQYQLSNNWNLWAELSGQGRWREGGVPFQQHQFVKAKTGLKYRF